MKRSLRILIRAGSISLLLASATLGLARADQDEFQCRVVNAGGSWLDVNVRIYETWTGRLMGDFRSNRTGLYNFGIDINGTPAPVQLSPGVQYTLYFGVPLSVNAYLQGSLCPPGATNCDAYYEIGPDGLGSWRAGSASFQRMWGFNQARHNAFPVTLSIVSATRVGAKTNFRIRATSSGGSPYTYAWSNVGAVISAPNQNPNDATRTVVDGQTVTVSVSVNNGAAVRSITLDSGAPVGPLPTRDVTWTDIKTLYR